VADRSVGITRRGTGKGRYLANLLCRKFGRTATSGIISQHGPDRVEEPLIILFRFDLSEDFRLFGPAFTPKANRLSPKVKVIGYVFIARPRICFQDYFGSKHLTLRTEATAHDFLKYSPLFLGHMDS
jgi:hypothetical protein